MEPYDLRYSYLKQHPEFPHVITLLPVTHPHRQSMREQIRAIMGEPYNNSPGKYTNPDRFKWCHWGNLFYFQKKSDAMLVKLTVVEPE